MSAIDKFINEEEIKSKVQGFVPQSLYERVNKIRERKSLTWHELLEALFKRLDSEEKKP